MDDINNINVNPEIKPGGNIPDGDAQLRRQKRKRVLLIIGIASSLLVIVAFFGLVLSSKNKELKESQRQVTEAQNQLNAQQMQINELQLMQIDDEYRQIEGQNIMLANDSIVEKYQAARAQIEKLRAELNNEKNKSAAQIKKLTDEVNTPVSSMHADGQTLDTITFSGNGEPTVHPDFAGIIDDTMRLRDKYFPQAVVSVLCNSTRLGDPKVVEALEKVDNAILKLDSAIEPTMRLIDRPTSPQFTVETLIPRLAAFGKKCIIQTMLLRGEHEGRVVDNTTPEEVDALVEACRRISPREVMLYSIDRKPPAEHLQKVPREDIEAVAVRLREAGIPVQVN